MNHNSNNHYFVMFFIMILSGLLSSMNVWVNDYSDIRFSINDLYMTLLMTGWMFLFMGIFYKQLNIFIIGLITIIINIMKISAAAILLGLVSITGLVKGNMHHEHLQ